jgi:hypothetical protein
VPRKQGAAKTVRRSNRPPAGGVVIAPLYIEPILEHMQEDGLEITTGAPSISGQIKNKRAH